MKQEVDQSIFIPFIDTLLKNAPTRIIKKVKNKAIAKGTITKYTTLNKLKKSTKTALKRS
jgi:hypothetical protein